MRGDLAPETAAKAPSDAAPADLPADKPAGDSPPRAGWSGAGGADRRLAALDAAVQASPQAPANYLLRAELYARLGEDALALADFERAQALADSALAADRWGLINQALRDRAAAGAAAAARRLARRGNQPGAPVDADEDA